MSRAAVHLLPDDHPAYIPGVGEVTLGDIRPVRKEPLTLADPLEPTLAMWEFIATHPRTTLDAWQTFGATERASGGPPSSASTSAGKGALSKSSGTSKGKGTNGASST